MKIRIAEPHSASESRKAPITQGIKNWIIGWPRSIKRLVMLSIDTVLCALAVQIAFYLRLGVWPDANYDRLTPTIAAIGLAIPLFIRFGFYRAILRYTGLAAFTSIAVAIAILAVPYAALFTFYGLPRVPRTLGLLVPIIIFGLVGGSRGFVRLWLGDLYLTAWHRSRMPQALIYGAGEAGRQLARAVENSGEMNVAGFIDDNPNIQGATVNGLKIQSLSSALEIAESGAVDEVLLAMPSMRRARRLEVVEKLKQYGLQVRTLPSVTDLARGKVSVRDLKEIQIEDLLGRSAVPPDSQLMRQNIVGRVVMVTGAGGSIGMELCRQIVRHQPDALLLFEISEYSLYAIHEELLRATGPGSQVRVIPILGSVQDRHCVREVLDLWRPSTIFHAAAYKHVPLVEMNLVEGVQNNVQGTLVMAELASEFGVSDFTLVSTDKAVRPTNAMGASKRLAEMLLQQMVSDAGAATSFSMVRFGNVLGSSGSVVPLFRTQIASQGPVTITHADMTRYFMTIPEASQLVIQANAMAEGGEVFLLDMGRPIKIMDLARNMILLSGLTVRDSNNPEGDIEIQEVGLRPGEKLYEELLIGDNPMPTVHPRIFKSREKSEDSARLNKALEALNSAFADRDGAAVRAVLQEIVAEYRPNSSIADWTNLVQPRSD